MERALVELVRGRAGGRCEYCRFPRPPFHIEHIIAQKHGGPTTEANLALACVRCNYHKGPNLSGIDPEMGRSFGCFTHGRIRGRVISGGTAPDLSGLLQLGRATIAVLEINQVLRMEARKRLIADGAF